MNDIMCKIASLVRAAVILGLAPALGCAGADQAVRGPWRNLDRAPAELRMVMNPGKSGKAIIFRTDDGEQMKGEDAVGPQQDADQAPIELRMVLDPGESGNTVIFTIDNGDAETEVQGAAGRRSPAEPFSSTGSGEDETYFSDGFESSTGLNGAE
jgi:hypothetical protein